MQRLIELRLFDVCPSFDFAGSYSLSHPRKASGVFGSKNVLRRSDFSAERGCSASDDLKESR